MGSEASGFSAVRNVFTHQLSCALMSVASGCATDASVPIVCGVRSRKSSHPESSMIVVRWLMPDQCDSAGAGSVFMQSAARSAIAARKESMSGV